MNEAQASAIIELLNRQAEAMERLDEKLTILFQAMAAESQENEGSGISTPDITNGTTISFSR